VRTVSIVTVPIVTASAVAVGVAVHAVGELQANVTLARAGGAVALLALARYAVTTAAPRARWPLVAGLLVFAIAAATSLVWDESALRALPAADCGECFRRLLDGPDLAHVWWVGAVALIGLNPRSSRDAHRPLGCAARVKCHCVGGALVMLDGDGRRSRRELP